MSDKTYNRTINIFINGKEVENNLKSIEKEYYKLRNEVAGLVKGSSEYNQKVAELHKIKGILNDHKTAISGTKGAWDRAKDGLTGFMTKAAAVAGVAYGAWKGVKSIIDSSERLSDGWDKLVGGAKEMFTEFKLSLANVDFTNFIEGLTEAWRRGRALAEELDSLADFRAYQDYKISSLNRESRALQEIIKNRDLDIKTREDAANQREVIEKQIYDRTVELARRTFNIEKDTWQGRNKMAAEEAVKLYETVSEMDQKQREVLDRAWGYFMGIEGSPKKAAARLKGVGTGGMYAGISRDAINQFADYMELLESGEADVLPKLFQAFKNIEEATAQAQERFNTVIKERSAISQQAGKTDGGGGGEEDDDWSWLGILKTNKSETEKTVKQLRKNVDDAYAKIRPTWMKNVVKDAEFRAKVDKEINDKIIKQREDMTEQERKQLDEKIKMYSDFATSIGDQLGQMLATEQLTAEQAAKQLVIIALDSLKQFANIYIAQGMMREVGSKGFIGIGTGIALGVIINTILSGVEAKLRQGLYTGGYTGWRGQYEPAGVVSGSVVHGQEWVANRSMVTSPVYGPMIHALEQVQRSGLASGGYAGSGGGSSVPALVDPELKALMTGMQRLLYKLDNSGVRMEFGMREADGVRKSMNKLIALEGDVSL